MKSIFDAGAEAPALPTETASPMAGNEQCVPLAALAMPEGEGQEMTNPEPGDQVDFQVGGKVTRIEGENAYVAVDTVNGQPVATEAKAPEDNAGDELAQLEQDAQAKGYLQ